MTEEESFQRAFREQVRICSYDSRWVEIYREEKERLQALFPGFLLGVEQVGRTAVSGMAAKPIIDMIGGVRSLQEADLLLPELCRNGYITSAEFNATLPDSRWLMKHANGFRTPSPAPDDPPRQRMVGQNRFSRGLENRSRRARRYQHLKTDLAETMSSDREAYTSAKTGFIAEVLRSRLDSGGR